MLQCNDGIGELSLVSAQRRLNRIGKNRFGRGVECIYASLDYVESMLHLCTDELAPVVTTKAHWWQN